MRKRITAVFLCFVLLFSCTVTVTAAPVSESGEHSNPMPFDVDARSAILVDARTGAVLYAKNPDEALPPASVTKIMTLLLVMEAISEGRIHYKDTVTASENATSMGGSQIYLKVGEQMSVEDLIKSVVIASANDAALALAEHIAGSEDAFVRMMNEKAKALGMKNTHFENTNGLDDTTQNHVTSARDIAIMSRALLAHTDIMKYTTTWMDSIRGGAFGLTNTNRLVRFYPGATGLKTGSTAKAKFCISASAERDGLHLIAVIMASPTRDTRNESAKKLLDFGFANYGSYTDAASPMGTVAVRAGVKDACAVQSSGFSGVLDKANVKNVRRVVNLPKALKAPIAKGEIIGEISYYVGEKKIGTTPITACESIGEISFGSFFVRMLKGFFMAN